MRLQTNIKQRDFKAKYKDPRIPNDFKGGLFWVKFVIEATVIDIKALKYLYAKQNIEEYTMYGETEEALVRQNFKLPTVSYRLKEVLAKRLKFFEIEKDNGNRQIRIYKDNAFIKDVLKAISKWSVVGKGNLIKRGAPQQLIKKYKLQLILAQSVTRYAYSNRIRRLYEAYWREKIDNETVTKYLNELYEENLVLRKKVKKRQVYKQI